MWHPCRLHSHVLRRFSGFGGFRCRHPLSYPQQPAREVAGVQSGAKQFSLATAGPRQSFWLTACNTGEVMLARKNKNGLLRAQLTDMGSRFRGSSRLTMRCPREPGSIERSLLSQSHILYGQSRMGCSLAAFCLQQRPVHFVNPA